MRRGEVLRGGKKRDESRVAKAFGHDGDEPRFKLTLADNLTP